MVCITSLTATKEEWGGRRGEGGGGGVHGHPRIPLATPLYCVYLNRSLGHFLLEVLSNSALTSQLSRDKKTKSLVGSFPAAGCKHLNVRLY